MNHEGASCKNVVTFVRKEVALATPAVEYKLYCCKY